MFSKQFLAETAAIASQIDCEQIERMVKELVSLRERKGRLFVIGLGGSAANASHMVNDLRKLCEIEAYAPTDNVAELTARANDDDWQFIFRDWFKDYVHGNDALFVLSVGGGSLSVPVSTPITCAVAWAKEIPQIRVLGIIGRDGGVVKKWGDCVVVIPPLYPERITPHTEAFQAVVWHCLVSHPDLQRNKTKW